MSYSRETVFSCESESLSEGHCEEKWLGAGALAGWAGCCDEMQFVMLCPVDHMQRCTIWLAAGPVFMLEVAGSVAHCGI
jgi:hypothetical protein